MNPIERLAYLKGLIEGLGLDQTKKETRVITNLVDLLEEMVFGLTKLQENVNDIQEQVDAVDEDLGEIEKELYDDERGETVPVGVKPVEKKKDTTKGELYYEVTCPTCGDTICLDDEIIADGEIDCPNCG